MADGYGTPEFAARNMRGQFTLAYEASMAARFVGIIIGTEAVRNTGDPTKRASRIAVLSAAKKLIEQYADEHVKASLDAMEDFMRLREGVE